MTNGFSAARSNEISRAAFALADWFKARGERPDVFMELMSLIVVAEDQTMSEAEMRHAHELAAQYGWPKSDDSL